MLPFLDQVFRNPIADQEAHDESCTYRDVRPRRPKDHGIPVRQAILNVGETIEACGQEVATKKPMRRLVAPCTARDSSNDSDQCFHRDSSVPCNSAHHPICYARKQQETGCMSAPRPSLSVAENCKLALHFNLHICQVRGDDT